MRTPAAPGTEDNLADSDTWSSRFAEVCRRQARAIAKADPAGDELIQFVENVYEWPEYRHGEVTAPK